MPQSNALRRLEVILDEAVTTGDRNQTCASVLLKAMQLSQSAQNVMDFYELLNKAEEEANKLKNLPKIHRYLQTLENLHQLFVVNHVWSSPWETFAPDIANKNVLNTLDALANYLDSQNPTVVLEQDFLENLKGEFESLLNQIRTSDLSRELQKFLIERIEDILKAIRRYHIDGTEGLKKTAQSLVSDLVLTEHTLNDVDKKNPMYRKVKTWVLAFLIYITPTPYDIIGAVPDIHDFWVPKFEELVAGHEKIESIICETSTIQEAVEKALNVFDRQPQKSIAGGRELKALPASKEASEASTDDKSDP